jgi:hypothetical protein
MTAQIPSAKPSLADQVAAIDAVEVAARIVAGQGTRAAIGASAAEIIALAALIMKLAKLADLTFDLLSTADLAVEEKRPEQRKRLTAAVRLQVGDVAGALEALGYGQQQPPKENDDVTSEG